MPNQTAEAGRAVVENQEQEKSPQQPQQDAVPPGCSVYVGNLQWGVRSEELTNFMSRVGEVVRADVFEDYNGRSKGCAVVVYKDEQSAKRAIVELTDTRIRERPIFVREDREEGSKMPGNGIRRPRGRVSYNGRGYSGYNNNPTSQGSGSQGGTSVNSGAGGGPFAMHRQIFVTNLPWRTTWQDLKDLFRECGDVIRADVMELPGGKSKGMGTVLFSDPAGAKAAVETFNNYTLSGRQLLVKYDRKEQL